MSVLTYKTRGNSNPQGKSRIYFTCHPDDFNKYFASITDDLLKRQNCAIWYREEMNVDFDTDEEMELLLGQMQLFVIPVSTNLLTKPNHAMDVEIPLAIRLHIPLLPLMQEDGLDQLFTRKFGNLQYISPCQNDITAISFDEKLEKYLKSILIGDELAEKVRAAFDAYIFMSYRKKDRKYAQMLMRLIHNIPACRDIAIWYDEYLVPGENFNDTIAEALKKSDLFTLVVTPNLVNEQNYILSTEYPMARKEQKPVLPVEMVLTEQVALKEKYEDIPSCLPGENGEEFDKRFLDMVRKLAIEENDASPEHNFFIGLAYLDGIDVEVDTVRAAELIEGSANAGLVEAMHMLAIMYRDGKGVGSDRKKAEYWLRECKRHKKKQYDLNPSQESFDELCEITYELTELYWYNYSNHLTKSVAWLSMEYSSLTNLSKEAEAKGYKNAEINLFRGILGQGQLSYRNHANGFGMREITKACYIIDALEKKNKGKYLFETGVAKYMRGNCFMRQYHLEKTSDDRRYTLSNARSEYHNAIRAFEQIMDKDPVVIKGYIYICYERLGESNFREEQETKRNVGKYKEYITKSINLCKDLIEEYGWKRDESNLAIFYANEGDRQLQLGQDEKAYEYYTTSIALFEKIKSEGYDVYSSNGSHAYTYQRLAKVLRRQHKFAEAETYLERAVSMFSAMYTDTQADDARDSVIYACKVMHELKKEAGDEDGAQKWWEAYNEKVTEKEADKKKAEEKKARLRAKEPEATGRENITKSATASSLVKKGDTEFNRVGDFYKNYDFRFMNPDFSEQAVQNVIQVETNYRGAYSLYAEVYRETQDGIHLRDCLMDLRKLEQCLAREKIIYNDHEFMVAWKGDEPVDSCDTVFLESDINKAENPADSNVTMADYDKMKDFFLADPSENTLNAFYTTYDMIGHQYVGNQEYDAAVRLYKNTASILSDSQINSSKEVKLFKGQCYFMIGDIAVDQDNYFQFEDYMERAVKLFKKAGIDLSDKLLWEKAVICRRMANCLLESNSLFGKRHASEIYRESIQAIEAISEEFRTEEIERFLISCCFEAGKQSSMKEYYEHAIQVLSVLVDKMHKMEDVIFLQKKCAEWALNRCYSNKPDEACMYFDKALELLQELIAMDPENMELVLESACLYRNYARTYCKMSDFEKAYTYAKHSLEIVSTLNEETHASQIKKAYQMSIILMAQLYWRDGKSKEFEKWWKKYHEETADQDEDISYPYMESIESGKECLREAEIVYNQYIHKNQSRELERMKELIDQTSKHYDRALMLIEKSKTCPDAKFLNDRIKIYHDMIEITKRKIMINDEMIKVYTEAYEQIHKEQYDK